MGLQPRISVLIPTLNSSKTLGFCLDSLKEQEYPKENLEIVFADGGSVDATRTLIEEFRKNSSWSRVAVIDNPLKTGEAGKAVALKAATGDICAFIDSDNILVGSDWLCRMVAPF
jgi:glycosyltransferase involved in cell wall biosynthesis